MQDIRHEYAHEELKMCEIRGLMLDPARLTERREVYRDYISLASRWNYNMLFWHFTDDQGCAVRLPSHPELATPFAYTPEEMRELIAYAAAHGVEIVPELECFGHTGFITSHPRYAHLRDGVAGKLIGALCIFEPAARTLLRELLQDTAELFPSQYIHAGMDETAFGEHPAAQRALRRASKPELYAEHVCWLHREITRLGKTMMMWADHLYPMSRRELAQATYLDADSISSAIAERLPRDIVMCVWQYNPRPRRAYVTHLQKLGFRVLVCPAVSAYGVLAHPRQWNLDNLADSARLARACRATGMVTTVWCPYRYFPGVTLFGIAYSAACRDAHKTPRPPYAPFARETFGLKNPQPVARALRLLHEHTPHKHVLHRVLPVTEENLTGMTDDEVEQLYQLGRAARRAHTALQRVRPQVRQHRVYYDDIMVTADCLARLGSDARLVKELADGRVRERTLNKLLSTLRIVRTAARQRWNATRYANDPKRFGDRHSAYSDTLLGRIDGACAFYARLRRTLVRRRGR